MLSILIPVYNFDIRKLVEALHQQAVVLGIPFEILCFDDGSTPHFQSLNASLAHFPGVKYKVLPQNLGRSAIRNYLGQSAQYEYLIFMDCDSGIVHDDYLARYIKPVAPDRLLYGGRVYDTEPPAEKKLYFHWWYGRNREQMEVAQRQAKPYHSFMTNNFLIPKAVFLSIQFDERLKQYGHEDTLFGLELKRRAIPIYHLDNPLVHLGLESTEVFLAKTKKGIENLYFLWKAGTPIESRLLDMYKKVKRFQASWGIRTILRPFKPLLLQNFRSNSPNLKGFDLYKLLLLLEEEQGG